MFFSSLKKNSLLCDLVLLPVYLMSRQLKFHMSVVYRCPRWLSGSLSCVLIIIVLFFNAPVRAVEDKNQQLKGLKIKIKQASEQLRGLKNNQQALYKELKAVDKQLGTKTAGFSKLQKLINHLQDILQQNKRQRIQKQKSIGSQKKTLKNQLQAAYRMGKSEKLKLMLNQQNPALTERVMVYYDYFNNNRLQKINSINQQLSELDELQQRYDLESAELEKKLAIQKQELEALTKVKSKRAKLLGALNKRFQSKAEELKRFKQDEKKLKNLIHRLQQQKTAKGFRAAANKAFAKLKGQLPWPVKGRLLKKFREKRADSRWDGVLIGAKEGQEVHAVSRGQVVFADWLRGYGLLTIIKHDNNYMTLYAFNQSLFKAKGDWVEAGTVISTVGRSGGRANAALYFGIRKKGKPVNPVKWCRKVRRGKVG